MKRCTLCRVEQPFDQFAPQPNNGDGLHAHCRTCTRARWKAWHAGSYRGEFAARRKQKSRDYYHSNREAVAARAKARRADATPEQRAARAAKRRARYHELGEVARLKGLHYAHARNALKLGNVVAAVDLAAILAEHGMVCHLCGGDIATRADLHFDHVVPLSLGGAHEPENIRPAHAFCNLSKGNRIAGAS